VLREGHDLVLLSGISLKQEGISYLCGQELPAVIVNMMRGGPGWETSPRLRRIIFRPPAVGAMATTGLVLAPASGRTAD